MVNYVYTTLIVVCIWRARIEVIFIENFPFTHWLHVSRYYNSIARSCIKCFITKKLSDTVTNIIYLFLDLNYTTFCFTKLYISTKQNWSKTNKNCGFSALCQKHFDVKYEWFIHCIMLAKLFWNWVSSNLLLLNLLHPYRLCF